MSDNKWYNDKLPVEPDETQLLIVALLMRLYDLNLALLREVNEERAEEIFAEHNRGGNFNPVMYVPDLTEPVEEEIDE